MGLISTSLVKVLGMTLCLCLIAIAMDVVWGYCGILSLGHFAFFGLGGYAIGMWLMYARTEIVIRDRWRGTIPPTEAEVRRGVAAQIFGVVGSSELPLIWSLCRLAALSTGDGGAGAGAFGAGLWLAGVPQPGDRGVPVDPDTGHDAGAVALPVPERHGPARQQRAVGVAEHSRLP
jgi:ABC-type branched-subunit amino acid transport system permease subunit